MNIDIGRREIWICAGAILLAACAHATRAKAPGPGAPVEPWRDLLPAPVSAERGAGAFPVAAGMVIVAPQGDAGTRIARQLAEMLRRTTGVLPGILSSAEGAATGRIVLSLDPTSATGDEGYDLTVGPQEITIKAAAPAGLFYGVQTFRQLLPYWSEYEALNFGKPKPASVSAVHIVDRPRFAWRGAMLDVARHFFGVEDVKRYIDLLALYKFNRLHLHLADDQGWRIEIKSWPELATRGGSREVGGGVGGFFTQQQYADLVSYAADRFITDRPRDRHARAHECGTVVLRRVELQWRGPGALHRNRGRVQRALRRQGRHLPVHRRCRPRDRRADPRPVFPRGWRRGEDADAGAVQAVRRARPDDRAVARQADGRLGRSGVRHAAADVDRPALAPGRLPGAAGRLAAPHPVPGQPVCTST